MSPPGRAHAGFSLIEVLVGLGLLAGVLISVAGLLVLGSRQMNSGRSSSEALAVARDVFEQMGSWAFHQTYLEFACDASATECLVNSDVHPRATSWKQRLDETLAESRAEIRIEGLDGSGAATRLADARALRLTVTVFWSEGPRARSVRLVTVRV